MVFAIGAMVQDLGGQDAFHKPQCCRLACGSRDHASPLDAEGIVGAIAGISVLDGRCH